MKQELIPLLLIGVIVSLVVLFQVVRAVVWLLDPSNRRTIKARRLAKAHLQRNGYDKIKVDNRINVLHDRGTVYHVGFQEPNVTVAVNFATGKVTIE